MIDKIQGPVLLAGDIGGTKTNLALFRRGRDRPEQVNFESFPSSEYSALEDILEAFVKKIKVDVNSACFGIAGPVTNGRAVTTNLPWVVDEDAIIHRFKWEKVKVINDLTATALAIPSLRDTELEVLNEAVPLENEPIGLLAPGTGLGVSLVIQPQGEFIPIASEGGHADFAPQNRRQFRLMEYFAGKYGHVSLERIVSGPGILAIYNWLRSESPEKESQWMKEALEDEESPELVTRAAIEKEDPLCLDVLDLFASIFGACAGNLALTGFTRGGVYLGGGVTPKILPILKRGSFLEGYVSKGRFREALMKIPVYVILNDQAALLGAARVAEEGL